MWTADVVGILQMSMLSELLEERGTRLQQIGVEPLLHFTGTRALVRAIKDAGKDIERMGEQEIAVGKLRFDVPEAAAELSKEVSTASDALAARGMDELLTAGIAGLVARVAAAEGVAEIAKGAELMGEGEAVEAMREALEKRAK